MFFLNTYYATISDSSVNFSALTADLGTVLEIDPIETFDNALENDRDYAYDCGSSKEYFAMGKGEDGKDIRGSPGQESFANFAEKMIDVQHDGRVKKRVRPEKVKQLKDL